MAVVTGLDQIIKAMNRLPDATAKKTITPAARAAAVEVQKQAKANVKESAHIHPTGFLMRNIIVKKIRPKREGDVRFAVAIKGKILSQKGTRPGLYGSVLEFGKEHQPPRPWLRPAAHEKANDAINTFTQKSRSFLDSAVEAAKNGS